MRPTSLCNIHKNENDGVAWRGDEKQANENRTHRNMHSWKLKNAWPEKQAAHCFIYKNQQKIPLCPL